MLICCYGYFIWCGVTWHFNIWNVELSLENGTQSFVPFYLRAVCQSLCLILFFRLFKWWRTSTFLTVPRVEMNGVYKNLQAFFSLKQVSAIKTFFRLCVALLLYAYFRIFLTLTTIVEMSVFVLRFENTLKKQKHKNLFEMAYVRTLEWSF